MKIRKAHSPDELKAITHSACVLYYKLYAVKQANEKRLAELRGLSSDGIGNGNVGFSGGVHLYDILQATRKLRVTLHEQQTEILALEDFDVDAAFKEVRTLVLDIIE